jgi:hypothetical protein
MIIMSDGLPNVATPAENEHTVHRVQGEHGPEGGAMHCVLKLVC